MKTSKYETEVPELKPYELDMEPDYHDDISSKSKSNKSNDAISDSQMLDVFTKTFDANRPYVYVLLFTLLYVLYSLKLKERDVAYILINIIVYIIITTFMFYLYSKNERTRISEKYLNDFLSLLHDTHRDGFDKFLAELRRKKMKSNDDITFLRKNITFILGIFFIVVLIVFYSNNLQHISLISLLRNGYYIIILGLTEIYLMYIVISRIPLPDVMNLIDAFVRRREICSKENIGMMISTDDSLDLRDCSQFKKSGDSCIVKENNTTVEHRFTCNDGRINRTSGQSIKK